MPNTEDILKDIDKFTEKEMSQISKKNQEIEARILISNKQAKRYKELKEKKPNSAERITSGLEIQFENNQILNEKFNLVQFFCEDIYKRIELLGKETIKLSKAIEKLNQEGRKK
jgi:hypothetical protein